MKATYKASTVTRPYSVVYKGYAITLPAGWPVSNKTASGPDDAYRFAGNTGRLAKELTGFPDSLLAHDLKYYGLNVPAEYCAPYA